MANTDPFPLNELTAVGPLDGRYGTRLAALRPIFSEYGLIKNRVRVEVEWLLALADHPEIKEAPTLSAAGQKVLRGLIDGFSLTDAERVKQIEKTTNHDVKAVNTC